MVKRSKRVTSREKNCAASQGSKLHDNEQQRLIFEQASSSILTFDFSAALPALELFLPSSDSFWTSGMYPGLFARRISASDIFFYFFCIFFFGRERFRFRFISKWHALEFEAACQRCVQPEHAEKHTQGEEGSSNVKNFVKIKGRS